MSLTLNEDDMPEKGHCACKFSSGGVLSKSCKFHESLHMDAARYRVLRNQDIEPPSEFPRKGVFIGEIREAGERDVCLTHSDADRACDAMLASTSNRASTDFQRSKTGE